MTIGLGFVGQGHEKKQPEILKRIPQNLMLTKGIPLHGNNNNQH